MGRAETGGALGEGSLRAALIPRHGPPEVLEVRDVALPKIGKHDVLVRVCFSSVNPVDCYLRHGGLRRFAHLPLPIIPGVDIAGIVERIGPNVREFRAGDEVFGFIPRGTGACAEFAGCRGDWLARKPAALSECEAAVLPCVALTALQALRDKARLRSGESVLIIGASGGVGTVAVQIAQALGLEVTAVCSTHNIELARRLGATRVIDYTKQDLLCEQQEFDAVFDCIGTNRFWRYRKLLSHRGRHVGISCKRVAFLDSAISYLLPGRRSFQFHVKAQRADLDQLAEWVREGKLRPIVSQVLPLEKIAEAHRLSETRRTVGKIAIAIQQF